MGCASETAERWTSQFQTDVNGILETKGFVGHCYAMERLIRSVDDNSKCADRKVSVYKPMAILLLTITPLLSATLCLLIGASADTLSMLHVGSQAAFFISVILTVCTILISLFMPGQRFQKACHIGVGLDQFRIRFLAELEKLTPVNQESLANFVEARQKEFEHFQVALIELALPLEMTSQRDHAARRRYPTSRGVGMPKTDWRTAGSGFSPQVIEDQKVGSGSSWNLPENLR